MNEVFENIIEKLEENFFEVNTREYGNVEVVSVDTISDIIKQIAAEYNNGWIPCSERLPEENGEYNVMIQGAKKATSLDYIGYGRWYDEVSKEYYSVTAWQPLPEPYKEEG